MSIFSEDYIRFFAELRENNTREWFHDQKKRFDKTVKAPFEKFVAEMIRLMREIDPELQIEPKQAIFRIYRDTRFSADKTPYKVQMSAIISKGGRKELSQPGMYIETNENYVRVYSGIYQPEKDQLEAIRYGIMEKSDEFNKLIAEKEFVKYFGEVRGEKNKILPKQFKEAAATQPYLFHKQFYYFSELPSDWLLKDELPAELIKRYKVCKPLSQFLWKAMQEG